MRRPKTKSKPVPQRVLAPVASRPCFPIWLMAASLALVTIALYWQATRCDFINYDDSIYVTENPQVQAGLNWEGVKWAFSNTHQVANWHPLTWLSHMLDCQLFGLNPFGHHLTSVLLHAANTVLVFVLLQLLTGAFWRSGMVAAVFGWHPLHVESVAWVAERKDVLSTFFGLLVLILYARYAKRRLRVEGWASRANKDVPVSESRLWTLDYILALLFFVLGLMSKPMLVTWPFVMLLLDYWPLNRFSITVPGNAPSPHRPIALPPRLLLEKLPFFVLAALASIVTFVVQKQTSTPTPVENLPLGARSGNALISYCRYLEKLFWPADLSIFYPHPGKWPMEWVILAGGLILSLTVLLIVQRRRYPFLLMGWLWYCGTLVPVIGVVQVGDQAMADRYTYVPSLGVLILTFWGVYELTRRWRYHQVVLTAAGCAVIVLCLGLTRRQLSYWRDSETLFQHALEVTENNYVAHNNLGAALDQKGQTGEAINQYREALRVNPDFAEAHSNLGAILGAEGKTDEAIDQFREVVRLTPDDPVARYNLGTALGRNGQIAEAISQFQEALRLKPDFTEARSNLAHALELRNASIGH